MVRLLGYSLNDLRGVQRGLLGVEWAANYWGYSTFNPFIPIFMIEDNDLGADGYFVSSMICNFFAPNVNKINTVDLGDGLYVTDREQTIVDMLRYNRSECYLYETVMYGLEDSNIDKGKLDSLAKQYGVLEKMCEVYKVACDDFENA